MHQLDILWHYCCSSTIITMILNFVTMTTHQELMWCARIWSCMTLAQDLSQSTVQDFIARNLHCCFELCKILQTYFLKQELARKNCKTLAMTCKIVATSLAICKIIASMCKIIASNSRNSFKIMQEKGVSMLARLVRRFCMGGYAPTLNQPDLHMLNQVGSTCFVTHV